jgi:transcriptional regulator with XRE-family HTH domain
MGRSQRPRPKKLSFKLAQIRKALGLTLEEMVKQLNYTESPLYPSNVFEFEKNRREPPLAVILSYARRVNISTDYLIDDALSLPNKLPVPKRKRPS